MIGRRVPTAEYPLRSSKPIIFTPPSTSSSLSLSSSKNLHNKQTHRSRLSPLSFSPSHFSPSPSTSPCLTASMAAVLDSVAVTRFSALPIAAPSASSAVSSVSGRRRSLTRLPEFKGLKVTPTSVIQFVRSVPQGPSSRSGRGGRVVCEAQDTALQG